MPVLLKESPQQIKNQAEDQGHQQHRNYWRVEIHSIAFIANIPRQLSKPVEAA